MERDYPPLTREQQREREEAAEAGRKMGERIGKKLARSIGKILDEAGVKPCNKGRTD